MKKTILSLLKGEIMNREKIKSRILELEKEIQIILSLFFIEKLTIKEIAKIFNTTKEEIKEKILIGLEYVTKDRTYINKK